MSHEPGIGKLHEHSHRATPGLESGHGLELGRALESGHGLELGRGFELHGGLEPGREADADWQQLAPPQVYGALVAVALLVAILVLDEDGFVFLLDHANLAFHEAGHFFFGFLGGTLGLYGGTLGQLVFPSVAAVSFWRRRQAVGFALSGVWLGENLLNIARYMADARARLLPLVGGGEHDWWHIFSRWGLVEHDTAVAGVTRTIGWLGMLACVVWLWRRYAAQSARRRNR